MVIIIGPTLLTTLIKEIHLTTIKDMAMIMGMMMVMTGLEIIGIGTMEMMVRTIKTDEGLHNMIKGAEWEIIEEIHRGS